MIGAVRGGKEHTVTDKIPVYEPDLSGNELAYVTDCVRSRWISYLGEYVGRFEEGFARFCGQNMVWPKPTELWPYTSLSLP